MHTKKNDFIQIEPYAVDNFVKSHSKGTLYHLYGWGNVIKKAYGHKVYNLIDAESGYNLLDFKQSQINTKEKNSKKINGILQLIHLKSRLFGNKLISLPYFDIGGILANSEVTQKALVSEAVNLAERIGVNQIELRHTEPAECFEMPTKDGLNCEIKNGWLCSTKKHKVRMLLELPDSSAALMKSFPAKLRSQIRKPIKEGLRAKIGGHELLEDFYYVFCVNMRDLGSPVHSSKMISAVLDEFPEESVIVIVQKNGRPLACSLMVGFKDTMENPWASSLKEYSRLSPNMLLYWTMLEYSCDNRFRQFDFGRSTPHEGSYKFKEQWGAMPTPLYWQFMSLNHHPIRTKNLDFSKIGIAVKCWQKLPVSVTRAIGPRIRKYISL